MSVTTRVRRVLRARRERSLPPLHFLHIGKTGGTAIRHAVGQWPSNRYRVEVHGHGVPMHEIPVGEPFFFVVREPIGRFVSGFNSRLREGLPRYDVPWSDGEAIAFARFPTPGTLARALSSADDDERFAAHAAMGAIKHVSTSYRDWFGDADALRARLDDVFFIGFQSQLDADFVELKALLGLPAQAALPDDDIAAHRSPPAPRDLDDLAERNLGEWYADDVGFVATCHELRATISAR